MLFEKFSVGKAFCWKLWDQRGTKNRTMVRTFVPKCLLGNDFLFFFSQTFCHVNLHNSTNDFIKTQQTECSSVQILVQIVIALVFFSHFLKVSIFFLVSEKSPKLKSIQNFCIDYFQNELYFTKIDQAGEKSWHLKWKHAAGFVFPMQAKSSKLKIDIRSDFIPKNSSEQNWSRFDIFYLGLHEKNK